MQSEKHLRSELRGHEEDVRGVITSPFGIVTASRDKTIRVWTEAGNDFNLDKSLVGHTNYVAPLAYVLPGHLPRLPEGGLLSGSRDNTVRIWNVEAAQTVQKLEGHAYQVTGVIATNQGEVISCSLDGTIRVWQNGQCQNVLKAHEGPVQCLLLLPNGDFLSGSNDMTIKLWTKQKCSHTFTGHTDTVRGLALLANIGVVSASHDQTLRVWTCAGDCIAELVGHTALVYSAACSDDGSLIASASEDNTVRIWQPDGQCLQTLEHPGCVWDVAWLADGDLVTACADYVARVWTSREDRAASAETVAGLAAALEARQQPKQGQGQQADGAAGAGLPPGLKMEEASVLVQPGKKDGEIKVVNEGGAGIAYSWDAARGQWEKIGAVVGGPSDDTVATGSKYFEGQQYDFVFDVDVTEGAPPLKLPVNRDDNPYIAADKFIERNGLPQSYKEQITQWILDNTAGAGGASAPSTNADPFTGGGAYVPGSSSSFPQPGSHNNDSIYANADPFTGSSRQQPSSTKQIPQRQCLFFDKALNAPGVLKKLREFNQVLSTTDSTQSLAVSSQQAEAGFEQLLGRVNSVASSSSSQLTNEDCQLLSALLRWPAAQLFPALDIARLAVLTNEGAQHLASTSQLQEGASGAVADALARATAEPQLAANQQTGLRLACNLCKQNLRSWLQSNSSAVLDRFGPCCSSTNKSVRLAFATLLLNLAVLLGTSGSIGVDTQAQALSALLELSSVTPPQEADTVARCLIAVGTIASASNESKQLAKDLNFHDYIRQVQGQSALDPKLSAVCEELRSLLQ